MSIKVVEKTEGEHISYEVNKNKITFGDDELTINLAAKERDYPVTLDICKDKDEGLVIGTGGAAKEYVAQIEIPERQYDIVDGKEKENGEIRATRVPEEFDINRCTLYLWKVEV